jgi:hypothetical protein
MKVIFEFMAKFFGVNFATLVINFFSKTFGGFRLSIAILTKFNVFFGNFLTSQS